jgi:hypothetical protein
VCSGEILISRRKLIGELEFARAAFKVIALFRGVCAAAASSTPKLIKSPQERTDKILLAADRKIKSRKSLFSTQGGRINFYECNKFGRGAYEISCYGEKHFAPFDRHGEEKERISL